MSLREQLEQIFDSSFSTQVQQAILRCLFDAYSFAVDQCKRFPKEEAHDLLPFVRWIQLRTLFRGLAERFQSVEASVEPNGTASSYHVCLISGQIKLTASTVDDPSALPPFANYRKEYAAQSQLNLFESNETLPADGKSYVILTHAKDRENPSKPAFANLIFPDKEVGSIVHKIDLFERHPEFIKNLIDPKTEEPKPQLRLVDKKKKNK
jgi:hypothetical protein